MLKKLLLVASLLLLPSTAALAACVDPLVVKDGGGASVNMSVGAGADTNCQSRIDWDTSSQAHADMIAPVPAGTNYIGQVGPGAVASGGWTQKWIVAANSDNATSLKGSAGIVHAVQVFGINAAPAYLKFYDKASSPTCASDTIVKQIMIPAAPTAANGAGAVILLDAQFSTGIAYCVVTGIGPTDDTSVTASNFVVNIDYK